jgi:hypothetical protein
MKTEIGNVSTINMIEPTVANTSITPFRCPSAANEKENLMKCKKIIFKVI